ncbi:MAG: hypothetical protein Q7R56_01055 [Nanoarchaeota archaeon]|nr:hypothetical protein [Nanoarchaeota archaeon]
MKEVIKVLITVLGIIAGLFGLINIVGQDLSLFIGLCSLSFGITALFFTLKARSVLSKGSSLREYTTSFAFCLILILIFSIWDTLIDLFQWKATLIYPKYFFITLAYFVFVYTSYRIFNIGKEFGFVKQAEKIKQAMKK